MTARILAVVNQKGGVGKTTTSINLAASLTADGHPTLLIDLDPQGNATTGSGVSKKDLSHSVYHVLLGQSTIRDCVVRSPSGAFDLIPSNRDLAGAEVELVAVERREFQLRTALADVLDTYEIVLIDCPPALNLLTVNGLAAADAVLIPMQCEYYALEGLSDLVQTIKRVRANLNPTLTIEGLLRTMFDPRNALALQVSDQLKRHFGAKLYDTIIPRNIRLAEAPSYGKPVMYHDAQSKGAIAYAALAGEILTRLSQRPAGTQPSA